ncbi:F-box only protein 33-like [Mercenaria mercenaria]|uniref:F-box only protein 33-like n=1 Tax=Mercenaria mercenaria TaxID=6596 RepID=UPI001E1DB158|nr:F-box only protein 33-like [Mercenaria mercenaria]
MAGHSWELMPSVIIVEILSYLALKDRLHASLVCRRWRSYLFQAKLWPKLSVCLRRNRRQKNKFLADVCGRFVRECAIYFDPHDGEELKDCYKILQILCDNKNLQVLQLQPRSCHIEWTETVTSGRFAQRLECIIRTSRKLRHVSLGCSEEILAHSGYFLDRLSSLHGNSLEALHLASVKEDSDNYGIVDLDVYKFRTFTSLKHLSIDYDFLDNQLLHIFSEPSRQPLETLNIHVHGVGPEHENVTNASWRQFSNHNKRIEVTINLIHSYTGVSKLLDILKQNLPLTHFRQFFCSNINVPALGLMANSYCNTLKSVHIVDGFEQGVPAVYEVTTDEDPFVMMAWKCLNLSHFTLIGYEMSDHDVVAIARLRGEGLQELHIPASCVHWVDEDNIEVVGNIDPEFAEMISSSLRRTWKPLEDDQLPDAVFDDWADAEVAYNDILLKDQQYRKPVNGTSGTVTSS